MFPVRSRSASRRVKAASSRPEHVSDAQLLLLPLVIAFLLALALAWPNRLPAQAAAAAASGTGTHTVRAGETLWSLAARYYGDGHKWRDLAAANGLPAGAERGIAVGQVLRVPAGGSAPVVPAASAPAAAAAPAAAGGGRVDPSPGDALAPAAPLPLSPLPAPRVGTPSEEPPPPAFERRIGLVRPANLGAARGGDNATVFIGPAPFDADTMAGTIWLDGTESFVAPATRRVGEFNAAPIALPADGWRAAGRVEVRAVSAGSSAGRGAQRMQQSDLVQVRVPAGADSSPGTQFVAVAAGPELGRGARLAIPTAVLTIEPAPDGRTLARVTRVYGVVEQGQALLAHEEAPDAPAPQAASPIEATVRWITDAPLLPSLQAYLVLASEALGEMATGDRFQLLADEPEGARVATVRVVRVTPAGATAIVTAQQQPGIRVGLRARRIGRAP
jgi:hypothetical protein